jgi:hypothetical protein
LCSGFTEQKSTYVSDGFQKKIAELINIIILHFNLKINCRIFFLRRKFKAKNNSPDDGRYRTYPTQTFTFSPKRKIPL